MGYREFVDDLGSMWKVWDVKPRARYSPDRQLEAVSGTEEEPRPVAPGWGNGWLAFQSEQSTRRLRPIPDRWEITGEHSLQNYLRKAAEVKPREST